jgi:hypothetical protein
MGTGQLLAVPRFLLYGAATIDLSLLIFPGLLHRLAAEAGLALRWY